MTPVVGVMSTIPDIPPCEGRSTYRTLALLVRNKSKKLVRRASARHEVARDKPVTSFMGR